MTDSVDSERIPSLPSNYSELFLGGLDDTGTVRTRTCTDWEDTVPPGWYGDAKDNGWGGFALAPGLDRASIISAYSLIDEAIRGGVNENEKMIKFREQFGYDLHLIRTTKGEIFSEERGKVDYQRGKTISGGTTVLYFLTQGEREDGESNPLTGLILPLFKEDGHAQIFFKDDKYLKCKRQPLTQGEFKNVVSFATKGDTFGGQKVKTLVDNLNQDPAHKTYMDSNELPSKPGSYLKGEIVEGEIVGDDRVTCGYPRNYYWQQSYREAMRMSFRMFFIVTQEWIESPNCLQELHWALEDHVHRPGGLKHFLVYFDPLILESFYTNAATYLNENGGAAYVSRLEQSRNNDNGFFFRKYQIEGNADAYVDNIARLVKQPLEAALASIDLRGREMLQGPNINSLIQRVASLETKVDRITTVLEQQMGRNVAPRPNVSQGRNQRSNEDLSGTRWV